MKSTNNYELLLKRILSTSFMPLKKTQGTNVMLQNYSKVLTRTVTFDGNNARYSAMFGNNQICACPH